MIYAPELTARSVKMEPVGAKLAKVSECCMCGRVLNVGDLHVPFKASATFMDGRELLGSSRDTCGYCSAHWNKTNMFKFQKFCATESKAWKLYSGVNKAWMFLNLPDEPFVMAFSDAKMQHLVWRTPVSLSSKFFRVRLGNRVFDIRQERILKAKAIATGIQQFLAEYDPAKGEVEDAPSNNSAKKKKPAKKKTLAHIPKHPFITVDGALDHVSFGIIRSDFLDHNSPDVAKATREMANLNLSVGEIWATGILCNYEPEEPELITLT